MSRCAPRQRASSPCRTTLANEMLVLSHSSVAKPTCENYGSGSATPTAQQSSCPDRAESERQLWRGSSWRMQYEVFHTILQITDRTIGTAKVASRAILTARLTLGAAPAQLLHVKGLEPDDFWKYVVVTAESMVLPWPVGQNSKLMVKFHKVTD